MFNDHVPSSRYRIKSVAAITGLSTHLIRKWEKRYTLFTLDRGKNGYRTFTEEDIQFLLFLKNQLAMGQTIGQLAQSGGDFLRHSMNQVPVEVHILPEELRAEGQDLVQAARRQDSRGITQTLTKWVEQYGLEQALRKVIFPLLQVVGDLWHRGGISISGEHHISQLVRQHIINTLKEEPMTGAIPALVACVPGDYHEIGPLATTFFLQKSGWHSTYLGPNMSFEVLQMALRRRQAQLMILSCILEPPRETMQKWLDTIVQDLQPLCQVMVGGTGFAPYAKELADHGVRYLRSIDEVKNIEIPGLSVIGTSLKKEHHLSSTVSS